jgi:hypothetical protein
MIRLCILVFVCLVAGTEAHARSEYDKRACAEVKEEIRTIEAKMRAGYTRAQGERYAAKLRELKRKRSKLCR